MQLGHKRSRDLPCRPRDAAQAVFSFQWPLQALLATGFFNPMCAAARCDVPAACSNNRRRARSQRAVERPIIRLIRRTALIPWMA
jgi:hypothetical protein